VRKELALRAMVGGLSNPPQGKERKLLKATPRSRVGRFQCLSSRNRGIKKKKVRLFAPRQGRREGQREWKSPLRKGEKDLLLLYAPPPVTPAPWGEKGGKIRGVRKKNRSLPPWGETPAWRGEKGGAYSVPARDTSLRLSLAREREAAAM